MAKTTVRGAQIADGANGVDLTVDVTGTLPAVNGGTGVTSLASLKSGISLDKVANIKIIVAPAASNTNVTGEADGTLIFEY